MPHLCTWFRVGFHGAGEPETCEELSDGQRVHVMPAAPPHGDDRHFELDYVLRASVAPEYVGSTDLLTRTSEEWNFAADASIRKQGINPATAPWPTPCSPGAIRCSRRSRSRQGAGGEARGYQRGETRVYEQGS